MARRKQTVPQTPKSPMSWTRFRLPPNLKWPNLPCLGSVGDDGTQNKSLADLQEGVECISTSCITLGRMVEFPQEAACLIEWGSVDDLNNFLTSPACGEFLQLLDGHEQEKAGVENLSSEVAGLSLVQTEDSTDVGREQILSSRRQRFLVLKHWEDFVPTSEIQGRVTLSTFVVSVADDNYDTVYNAYREIRGAFGQYGVPYYPHNDEPVEWSAGSPESRRRVWFYTPRKDTVGEEEEQQKHISKTSWLEETFGSGRGTHGVGIGDARAKPQASILEVRASESTSASTGGSGQPRRALMYEFRVWNEIRTADGNVRLEEIHTKNAKAKGRWDQTVGEWRANSRILDWRQERWDFEPVCGFRKRKTGVGEGASDINKPVTLPRLFGISLSRRNDD